MKSLLKISAFLALLAIGCFAFTSSPKAIASEHAAARNNLASLYSTNCARCHGANGKAQTAKGRELDADDLTTSHVRGMSNAKLTRVIKNGKGDMPAFRKLTNEQIAQIIRTFRSF